MIEISIAGVLLNAAKVIMTLIAAVFIYAATCWPVNDQPTTKVQYGIFIVVLVVVANAIFDLGLITWAS